MAPDVNGAPSGCSLVRQKRLFGVQETAGSNPAIPTNPAPAAVRLERVHREYLPSRAVRTAGGGRLEIGAGHGSQARLESGWALRVSGSTPPISAELSLGLMACPARNCMVNDTGGHDARPCVPAGVQPPQQLSF